MPNLSRYIYIQAYSEAVCNLDMFQNFCMQHQSLYIAEMLSAKSHYHILKQYPTIQQYTTNADCICDAVQGMTRMSSSFKDLKIRPFRKSKDVEVVNIIQEQETPTPSEKKKIGAKAKKLTGRLVPAALSTLSHLTAVVCTKL